MCGGVCVERRVWRGGCGGVCGEQGVEVYVWRGECGGVCVSREESVEMYFGEEGVCGEEGVEGYVWRGMCGEEVCLESGLPVLLILQTRVPSPMVRNTMKESLGTVSLVP